MGLLSNPTYALQPSAEQVAVQTNYISDFNFLTPYLPDLDPTIFERYGDRTLTRAMQLLKAESPSDSDQIKWTEQGRLMPKYTNCSTSGSAGDDSATITVNDTDVTAVAFRVNQNVLLQNLSNGLTNRALITAVDTTYNTFDVVYYEAAGQNFAAGGTLSAMLYGSEFKKATDGMSGTIESEVDYFTNSSVISKDNYEIAGTDMTQIGWIEVSDPQNGARGYFWYLKSQGDTRLRFNDLIETKMLEDVPAEVGSGVANTTLNPDGGNKGSDGVFYTINERGNVFGAGYPTTLADFDSVLSRLDKQGNIAENVIYLNRTFDLAIDDMLASQNSYGAGGTSYGLFNNDKDMALNLGFRGFTRGGYDFYKYSWKYLIDPTWRGTMYEGSSTATNVGTLFGMLMPVGTKSVYDENMGMNVARPFLHVRYRQSPTENRRYKSWVTGSAGGAATSTEDVMRVSFLTERCACTYGANNFFLFRSGTAA